MKNKVYSEGGCELKIIAKILKSQISLEYLDGWWGNWESKIFKD